MSIWNKVLVGVICVASLALFYLAARTLYIHQYWGKTALGLEAKIKRVQSDNQRLLDGTQMNGQEGEAGIRKLRRDLRDLLAQRGRVWRNCDAKIGKVSKDTGSVEVQVAGDPADPNSVASKGNILVYAFEEGEGKSTGRYLGEFRVTTGADKRTLLQSARKFTPAELDRLTNGPWTLYEEMPRDSHAVFAGLADNDKKALLPEDVVSEYLKDGKPAEPDDPQDRVVDGKYVRPLRDYRTLFEDYRSHRVKMVDLFEAATQDKEYAQAALAAAKREQQALEKRVAEAKVKLAKYERQRDIAADYHETLKKEVAAVTAAIAELLKTNKATAGQLARTQWDAVRHIDQRTRAVVQSNAGGK